MIDILAQTAKEISPGIVSGAITGLAGAGTGFCLGMFLIKKTISRVVNHVEDEDKHIPHNSVIVTEKYCQAHRETTDVILASFKENIKNNTDAIKEVHKSIDLGNQAILKAIQGLKSD